MLDVEWPLPLSTADNVIWKSTGVPRLPMPQNTAVHSTQKKLHLCSELYQKWIFERQTCFNPRSLKVLGFCNTAHLSHCALVPDDQKGLRHWQTNSALEIQGRYTPQFSERQAHRPVQCTNYSLKGRMNLENSYPREHWVYNVLTLTLRAWTHHQNREQFQVPW